MNDKASWPRVGCGAAIIQEGRSCWCDWGRDPEAGCWGLPGGKVDPFEPVIDATAREIREELRIIIEPVELLCLVDQIDHAAGHHWIAPVFRVKCCQGTPSIIMPEALTHLGWFGLDALPTPLTKATKQAAAAVRRSPDDQTGRWSR